MIPSLKNPPVVHDTNSITKYGVILVTLLMGLDRAEEKASACEFIHSYGNRFI